MSTGMYGMDVQDVRMLSQELNTAASEIHALIGKLTNRIGSAQWAGPDRERFHGDWTGTYVPQLTSVVNGLQAAATTASSNATVQEQASA